MDNRPYGHITPDGPHALMGGTLNKRSATRPSWFVMLAALLLECAAAVGAGIDFPPGHCVVEGRINKHLPTVVITHGWRYRNRDFDNPTAELVGMGREIEERMKVENIHPIAGGRRVNVIYYLWPEASRPLANGPWHFFKLETACRHAGETACIDGVRLASQLRILLGNNYAQPVQFIGHSFGALVNAYAVSTLADESRWRSEAQVTMLDTAFALTLLSDHGVRRLLPVTGPIRVEWVDNYFGPPFVAVGTKLRGAGPCGKRSGGMFVPTNHTGMIEYYRETIRNRTNRSGFFYSLLLAGHGGWNQRQPSNWDPGKDAAIAVARSTPHPLVSHNPHEQRHPAVRPTVIAESKLCKTGV